MNKQTAPPAVQGPSNAPNNPRKDNPEAPEKEEADKEKRGDRSKNREEPRPVTP